MVVFIALYGVHSVKHTCGVICTFHQIIFVSKVR